jgi:uncharacterized membrane protein (TIGR02234 family)
MSGAVSVRSRREKYLAAAVVLLGGGLMALSSSRPWVTATLHDALAGRLVVHVNGKTAAPVVPAVALVALAGAVAVLTARVWGRRIVGLVLVASGAAAVAVAVGVVQAPSGSVRSALSGVTGRTGDLASTTVVSGWPWAAVAGAVLVVLAGAVSLLRARQWSGLSDRYERPAEPGAPGTGGPGSEHVDPWDALSRGDDPTG